MGREGYTAGSTQRSDSVETQHPRTTDVGGLVHVSALIGRLKRESPVILPVMVGTIVVVALVIAFHAVLSGTLIVVALIVGGAVVGMCGGDRKDAAFAAFIVGLVAYFAGTLAFLGGASIQAGYPAERVAGEIAIGAFAGALFGVVAGAWSAGGSLIGSLVGRRIRHPTLHGRTK